MKKWENATIIELGLEKTEENTCTVNFEGASTYTAYPDLGEGCIWHGRYEPEGILGICKHYDRKAPGKCKLNISKTS